MNEDQPNPWKPIGSELPPEGVAVETKIDDSKGVRNECVLRRKGRLWFVPDMSIYVYYQPTHWRLSFDLTAYQTGTYVGGKRVD